MKVRTYMCVCPDLSVLHIMCEIAITIPDLASITHVTHVSHLASHDGRSSIESSSSRGRTIILQNANYLKGPPELRITCQTFGMDVKEHLATNEQWTYKKSANRFAKGSHEIVNCAR